MTATGEGDPKQHLTKRSQGVFSKPGGAYGRPQFWEIGLESFDALVGKGEVALVVRNITPAGKMIILIRSVAEGSDQVTRTEASG